MKQLTHILLGVAALALFGCEKSGLGKSNEPSIVLGREIGKAGGQSIVADTTSRFHINDHFNIQVTAPDGFRVPELKLMVYRIEDETGRQLGNEYLSRSQSLKGVDPKGNQLVINNSAKNRSVARFIGPKPGKYRIEIHTDQYKLASKEFEVYRKQGK